MNNMLLFGYIVCFCFAKETFSANILIADAVPSPSHQIWNYAIAEGLLDRGHNITMLSQDSPRPIKHKNFHFLNVKDLHKLVTQETANQEEIASGGFFTLIQLYLDYTIGACKISLKSEGFKALMNYPKDFKFDAILIDNSISNCLLPLIHKFNYPPSIGLSAFLLPATQSFALGNDFQPSYLPSFYTSYVNEMTFFERLENYLTTYMDQILRTYVDQKLFNLFTEMYDEDIDSPSNLANHVSLLLTNINFVEHQPQPLTPNIIPVGGLQIRPKKLPEDLQKIMDTAPHGVILFSLGTNINSDDLTPDKREAIIKTFSNLKQTVLWKFESNITDMSKNVIIRKWLPQTDILAHPNVILFISHSGALSVSEAVYFGVPVLGMPFFIDQHPNIQNLVKKKVAKKLDYLTLTSESFLADINDMISNKEYSQRMKELSSKVRDQPETPLERATFWIEYAIRHNGTHFLAPKSRSMSLFVTSCADIHLFLLVTLCFLFFVLHRLFKFLTFKKSKSKRD